MKKVKIHMVRHGQTMFNHEDIVQGWGDSFLTPDGINGVENLGLYWKQIDKQFDAVYASDSGRTLQTARVLLGAMGEDPLVVVPNPAFREYNFGYFEGGSNGAAFEAIYEYMEISADVSKTNKHMEAYLDAIAAMDKQKRGNKENTYLSEDYQTYTTRIIDGLSNIIQDALATNKENILVVFHGVTIQTMFAEIFLQEEVLEFGHMPNAGVTSFYAYEDGTFEHVRFADDLGEQNNLK